MKKLETNATELFRQHADAGDPYAPAFDAWPAMHLFLDASHNGCAVTSPSLVRKTTRGGEGKCSGERIRGEGEVGGGAEGWEEIVEHECAVKVQSIALNVVATCTKMTSSEHDPASYSRKVLQPLQTWHASLQTFKAVLLLREMNDVLEAEDAQRMELKDSDDPRLLPWRGKK